MYLPISAAAEPQEMWERMVLTGREKSATSHSLRALNWLSKSSEADQTGSHTAAQVLSLDLVFPILVQVADSIIMSTASKTFPGQAQ